MWKRLSVLVLLLVLGAGRLLAESPAFTYVPGTMLVSFRRAAAFGYLGEPVFGLKVWGNGRAVATLPEHYPSRKLERHGFTVHRRGVFRAQLMLTTI